jgi:hypothetical protein
VNNDHVVSYPSQRWETGYIKRRLNDVVDLRAKIATAQVELPAWSAYDVDDAARMHLGGFGSTDATDVETTLRLREQLDAPQFADDVNGVVPRIFELADEAGVVRPDLAPGPVVDQIERRSGALVDRLKQVRYEDAYGWDSRVDGWDGSKLIGPIGRPRSIRREVRDLAALATSLGEDGARFRAPLTRLEHLLETTVRPEYFQTNREAVARELESATSDVLAAARQTTVRRDEELAAAIRADLEPARELGPADAYAALLQQQRRFIG